MAVWREAISDNGRHWRPLTFQWLTGCINSKLLLTTVLVNATRGLRSRAVRRRRRPHVGVATAPFSWRVNVMSYTSYYVA